MSEDKPKRPQQVFTLVVEVGPGHTLRQAARLMAERNVGAAIVMDPDGEGPGILTERDVLRAVAAGEDPSEVLVSSHVMDEAARCDRARHRVL